MIKHKELLTELETTLEEFKASKKYMSDNVKDIFAIGFINQLNDLYVYLPNEPRIPKLLDDLADVCNLENRG